jgi:hypothetical protein
MREIAGQAFDLLALGTDWAEDNGLGCDEQTAKPTALCTRAQFTVG